MLLLLVGCLKWLGFFLFVSLGYLSLIGLICESWYQVQLYRGEEA